MFGFETRSQLTQRQTRNLRRFASSRRGAKFADYGLIVGVITVVTLIALQTTGINVISLFTSVNTQIETTNSSASGGDSSGPNQAPVWVTSGTQFLAPSQGVIMRLVATDANGDSISYSVISGALPDGLTLSGDVISGSPNNIGVTDVTFRADDGNGGGTNQTLIFDVSEPGYRFIRVVYADSDPLGSPGAYAGISEMSLFDANGVEYPSQAMTGNAAPSPLVATASTQFSTSFQAHDAFDDASGTYWSSSNSSGAGSTIEIDLGNGNRMVPARIDLFGPSGQSDGRLPANGRIEASNNGSEWYTLFEIKNYVWSANSNQAELDSPNYNDPPRWSQGSIGPLTIGIAISVELTASDPEGETISYSLTSGSLPSGLSLTGSTIAGTPNATVSGQAFSITATDASGASVVESFTVDVNEPSDFALDQSTANAAGAYSTRQLRQGYSGFALRLRNGSTNATTDIGFDGNGNLDSSAVSSHLGGANGFVVTWYDQSGSSNNASMSTTGKQPRLVGDAVVFDGVDDQLLLNSNSFSTVNDRMGLFVVVTSSDSNGHIVGTGSASAGFLTTYGHGLFVSGGNLRYKANSNSSGLNMGGSVNLSSTRVISVTERSGGGSSILRNGTSTVSSSTTAPNAHNYSTTSIGASAGSGTSADRDEFAGSINEIIIYDEALEDTDSSGFTAIRDNLSDHWTP
ncbi:MAG: hypothetical protein Alpg2KO_09210 [Alphaproteobacteria bacterium]